MACNVSTNGRLATAVLGPCYVPEYSACHGAEDAVIYYVFEVCFASWRV